MLCASHERCPHRQLSRFVRITSWARTESDLFGKSAITKLSSGYGSVVITDVSARSADSVAAIAVGGRRTPRPGAAIGRAAGLLAMGNRYGGRSRSCEAAGRQLRSVGYLFFSAAFCLFQRAFWAAEIAARPFADMFPLLVGADLAALSRPTRRMKFTGSSSRSNESRRWGNACASIFNSASKSR